MRSKDFAKFIMSREAVRMVKEGQLPAKTKLDPIITRYRFCNMVRADDRVTKFIFEWAKQYGDHEDLWFAFVVARLFNNPEALRDIAPYVLPLDTRGMVRRLELRKAAGKKNFNAAYIVSTNGLAMDKITYAIMHVLVPLWKARKAFRPKLLTVGNTKAKDTRSRYETLDSWHSRLQQAQGLGSFMAAQIVADLKYFPPYMGDLPIPLDVVDDWWTFAASGPGSRRGLNRVMGHDKDKSWKEMVWRLTLGALIVETRPLLPAAIGTRMSAQDYQNALCEFDKYLRAKEDGIAPKQLYRQKETEA